MSTEVLPEPVPAPSRLRRAGVWTITVLLLVVGSALTLTAGRVPVEVPFVVPAVVLLPLYFAAERRRLDFEFRRDTVSISLTQLPLALGLFITSVPIHIAVRLIAAVIDGVTFRRLSLDKLAFNVSVSVFEIGLATRIVNSLGSMPVPNFKLWLALFIGLLVGDLVGQAAIQVILTLLGRSTSRKDSLQPLAVAGLTSIVFTAVAVLALSAAWTDPATLVVTFALAIGLALAYRGYRAQSEREKRTDALFAFVKGLPPLEIESPAATEVLGAMCGLLHSRYLDLAVREGAGSPWRHVLATSEGGDHPAVPADIHLGEKNRALLADDVTATHSDRMTTPVLCGEGVVGILTAHGRLGRVRGFDMKDLRLLETLSSELSAALERGRLLKDLQVAAKFDALTGLPNLSETTRLLQHRLDGRPSKVLLAAVSVDSFRDVNDTLGHQAGDELLTEVSRRLRAFSAECLVGRIGGGRFAVAMSTEDGDADACMMGLGIRADVEGSAYVGAIGTHVRVSVGCATGPEHGRDAATLLRRAETAMYSARGVNGGPLIWEPAYEVSGQRRLAVVTALRDALNSETVSLVYQPKLTASTGALAGFEALARWTHPAFGFVSPEEFIPLAETSGLIGTLTASVLRQALMACRSWQATTPAVGVAVNVSAETVLDPAFPTQVAAALEAADVQAGLLTLELTESVFVRDPQLAAARMNDLKRLGVRLAVDDFGTGYSSLTYLKSLPIDEVKVDKGFVDGLVDDAADQAVVRAVVDIAHTRGLKVVAEGVETPEQHHVLASLGVDETQGYLYARPMPLYEATHWLASRKREVGLPRRL